MPEIKKRTLTLATIGLMTAACTSATAGNYADNNLDDANSIKTLTHAPLMDLDIDGETIQIKIITAMDNSLNEIDIKLTDIDIDKEKIIQHVQETVSRALSRVEADLKEMEIDLEDLANLDLKLDMDTIRDGLKRAIEEEHITKQEMNRILAEVAEIRKEALQQATEALEDVREFLEELREEARRTKED